MFGILLRPSSVVTPLATSFCSRLFSSREASSQRRWWVFTHAALHLNCTMFLLAFNQMGRPERMPEQERQCGSSNIVEVMKSVDKPVRTDERCALVKLHWLENACVYAPTSGATSLRFACSHPQSLSICAVISHLVAWLPGRCFFAKILCKWKRALLLSQYMPNKLIQNSTFPLSSKSTCVSHSTLPAAVILKWVHELEGVLKDISEVHEICITHSLFVSIKLWQ